MLLSEQLGDIIGREIPLGAKWQFEFRHHRWSDRMLKQVKQFINYLHIYEDLEQAQVAELIMVYIRDLYWDLWGNIFDVSSSDCTIYVQDHGGSVYAIFVEGPGPKDIYVPFSFTLKLWPSYQNNTSPSSIR